MKQGGHRGGGHRGHKRDRGREGGGYRGGFRSHGGGFGVPREMHKAVCAECGQECEVPFKPSEDRPVYCRDCFRKRRQF